MIHGGAVRIGNLVRRMAADFDLDLLILVGGTDDPEQRQALEEHCRRVFFQQLPEVDATNSTALPPEAAKYASPRIAERIAALVAAHRIDVVILEYAELGQYRGPFAGPHGTARVALVEHDLNFRSHARRQQAGFKVGESAGEDPETHERRLQYELAACREVDQVHLMSASDRDDLASRLGNEASHLRVIPNGVDVDVYHPGADPAERSDLLFVGSFPHLPNLDALDHFLAETWPQIRKRRPEARLTVAGARPPQRVLRLDGHDGVQVAGEVPDLGPLYRSHRALVVPLRAGSGTRLKILEAFASGLPVVSTTVGAEGIEAVDGKNLLIADEPQAMAAAAERLLDDDELCRTLSRHGRRLAEERYSWDAVYHSLRAALGELVDVPTLPSVVDGAEHSELDVETPEVSILIAVRYGGGRLRQLLQAIASQDFRHTYEIIGVTWGDAGASATTIADDPTLPSLRLIAAGPDPYDQGRSFNLAAAAARGLVLVSVAEGAEPTDTSWLEQLTAPFFLEASPAGVQGGISERLAPSSPRHRFAFTAESRRWADAHGGFVFSLANAAIQRDVWERFPFHEGPLLEDRRWQRLIATNRELILPCWGASIALRRPQSLANLWRRFLVEGAAWRRLGVRYSALDMVLDAIRPALYLRGLKSRHLAGVLLPLLRPIALWLGRRPLRSKIEDRGFQAAVTDPP